MKNHLLIKIFLIISYCLIFLPALAVPVFAQWCNVNGQIVEGFDYAECSDLNGDWLTTAPAENGGGQSSPLPGITDQSSIGDYVKSLYTYAIGIVGILATVVIMIGGLIWLSSMGNAARVGEAKAWIGAALTGLLLAMTSYTLLYIVNPNLVKFEKIGLPEIDNTSGSGDSGDSGDSNDSFLNYSCRWEQVTGGRSCSDALGYGWKNADDTNCPGNKGYIYLCCCIHVVHVTPPN